MQHPKHRLVLSLDAKASVSQAHCTSGILKSPGQASAGQASSSAQSASDLQGGGEGPNRLARLRSFVKVGGAILGHGCDSETPAEMSILRKAPSTCMLTSRSGTDNPAKTNSSGVDVSGPLLMHITDGGAKVELTLDRHIQYEADPIAASAWDFRNCKSAMASNPFAPESPHRDPFTDNEEFASVPRSLLCFTLSLEPFTSETAARPKENFEFLSLQLDFKVDPPTGHLRHQRTVSSPCLPRSGSSCIKHGSNSNVALASSSRPVVRGFAPLNLVSSNFLQEFGPILYRSLHKQNGQSEEPVVLGSGKEGGLYRSFERRLAQIWKPVVFEGDKFTARGCLAMAAAHPTPASATFRQASSPFMPTDVEAAEYGTSSIRIMVKRDPDSETTWASRKFPFLVLLEHPTEARSIAASIKLDLTTVRRTVHAVETPRTSLSSRYRPPRGSDSSNETLDPGYESSTSRYTPSSAVSTRRYGLHGRSMSETSLRSSSGRHVGEIQKTIQIYPRSDPISVISCGLGTVKDLLFQTGVKSKTSAKSAITRSASLGQIAPDNERPTRSTSDPRLNKPLPTPRREELESYSTLPTQSPTQNSHNLHRHIDSSGSISRIYERTGISGRLQGEYRFPAHDDADERSYSQDQAVVENEEHLRWCQAQGVEITSGVPRGSSRQASVSSSWTRYEESTLPLLPSTQLSRLRLVRTSVYRDDVYE